MLNRERNIFVAGEGALMPLEEIHHSCIVQLVERIHQFLRHLRINSAQM